MIYVDTEKKYSRLRVHSSIDNLPAEARNELEDMLADAGNGLGYRDMADVIEERYGIRLSVSAIGRYARRYIREVKQIDFTMNRMRAVAEYVQKYGAEQASACINALIQDGLMRRILDGQEDIADLDIRDALKYSLQAQRAAVYEYRYRDSAVSREEMDADKLREERLTWLRGVLRENPDALDVLLKSVEAGETGEALDKSTSRTVCTTAANKTEEANA